MGGDREGRAEPPSQGVAGGGDRREGRGSSPWRRVAMAAGEGGGRGGREPEGDVVLPRPPPQLPLPARCRVFPEAATGSRREQLRCSAILCHPLLVPHPSAAAAELTVSPGRSGALLSRRRPASALRAARAAAAGREARRRLSPDGPGHFCPVRDWRWRGGLPCARALGGVWAPGGVAN